MEQKTKIEIKLHGDEYRYLTAKAAAAGMSKSELIRNLIYYGTTSRRSNYSQDDAQKLLDALCMISNSLSDISYQARKKCMVDEAIYLSLEDNFIALINIVSDHITQ